MAGHEDGSRRSRRSCSARGWSILCARDNGDRWTDIHIEFARKEGARWRVDEEYAQEEVEG